MEQDNVEFISDVYPDKETWKLRVRIIRLWYVKEDYAPHHILGIHMIFLDEKGSKIQAFVTRKNLILIHKPHLEEGKCYEVIYGHVGLNNGEFRATRHAYRINFNLSTKVQPCETTIPIFAFDFVPISDILCKKAPKGYLIDVIGEITSYGQLDHFEKDGKTSDRFVMDIEDTSGKKIKCTLFGDYASMAIRYINESIEALKNVFCNSWNAFKLHFNLDIPEVVQYKQRARLSTTYLSQQMTQSITQTSVNSQDEIFSLDKYKTIGDIRESTEIGTFVTLGTIHKIKRSYGWYYESCNKCRKKVKTVDGQLICPGCEKTPLLLIPRYKIHVLVMNHTGSASFVLFDTQAYKLIHKTARELKLHQIEVTAEDGSFPEEIEQIVQRRYLFKVKITEFNVEQNSSFTVSNVTDDATLINTFISSQGINREEFEGASANSTLPNISLRHQNNFVICDDEIDISSSSSYTPYKRGIPSYQDTSELENMRSFESSTSKPMKVVKKEKSE
ncbi:replication protein A 70 kDa DNA-binding subunit E-like [Senna tora]|uniref:Replication protein A 70 kDa DNA-binding subunit E-like n=1 Tax=Senna tora TaxID=362788 RepID=A0A834TGK9_9FABA|nr:replication protein A 70 kDa DNA-binding subunit E-like [Senna tora]